MMISGGRKNIDWISDFIMPDSKKELKKNIILFLIMCMICLLILEIFVRVEGTYDSYGDFNFQGHQIRPYTLPDKSIENDIADYDKVEKPFFIYDQFLGWTINPNYSGNNNGSHNESSDYYVSNSIGIRSNKEFDLKKLPGVIRIALFGDSFIYSYETPENQSIAYFLQNKLSKDFNVEVMNFGGPGYGNDQAYLRWKLVGKNYTPDIVIIGFQPENNMRNSVIIFRLYHRPSKQIFSKPRFYLENTSLKLLNYPTMPYHEIPEFLRNYETSELSKFEYFYNPDDYNTNILFKSKAIAVLSEYLRYSEKNKDLQSFYDLKSNESILSYKIISTFYEEASKDSKVYILHIPLSEKMHSTGGLESRSKGKDYFYGQFLSKLEEHFDMINPDMELIKEAQNTSFESLFVEHYSNKSNYIIANKIYDQIYPQMELIQKQSLEKR